jgi:hypothetical protein
MRKMFSTLSNEKYTIGVPKEVFNNENDEKFKEKPIIYLPNYSYFGDYQILYNLKSNIVFKTLQIS